MPSCSGPWGTFQFLIDSAVSSRLSNFRSYDDGCTCPLLRNSDEDHAHKFATHLTASLVAVIYSSELLLCCRRLAFSTIPNRVAVYPRPGQKHAIAWDANCSRRSVLSSAIFVNLAKKRPRDGRMAGPQMAQETWRCPGAHDFSSHHVSNDIRTGVARLNIQTELS